MKQLNLLPVKALMILFAFFMVACDDEEEVVEEKPLTKSDLLTDGSQKTWYRAVQTPEGDFPFCNPSSPQAMDDTYTFYADGTFIYDHAAITEDPECTENCCTDGISIKGTWQFINEEKELELFAKHMKDEPAYTIDHVYITGNVEITADKLILSQESFTLEFLPK